MNITVRSATPGDAATIAAFNSAMAEETEGRALDPDLINPGVAAVLDDAAKGRYWVAIDDGADDRDVGEGTVDRTMLDPTIVGQIMVTYEWSDWRNGVLWWIQSVYIDARYRRRGVFSALYRHVETLARETPDCCGIRLYVERDNSRAQQTYASLGMVKPGYEVMEVDFRKETDGN